jgi:hypothetical protein
MKPGGYLFASWHDWRGKQEWFLHPNQAVTWKRRADLAYRAAASITYRLSGRVPPQPWNGTRETFQFRNHVPLILAGAGFVDVKCERSEHNPRTTARRP